MMGWLSPPTERGGPGAVSAWRRRLATIAVVFVALVLASPATMARQRAATGEIVGRLLEFDGTPLSGLTVRLEGPGGISRTTESDGEARFSFTALPPGDYVLRVDLPGVEVEGDTQVSVRPGIRVETTLRLGLFASRVTVNVTAESPVGIEIIDEGATSVRSTVDNATLDRLPLPAEQALEVLPLIPSVIRDARGRIAIDGTLPTDSMLLFNGIDLMDPFSGEYRVRLPLEAVDQVEIYRGVYPANYGQLLGGLVDVSTLPGGDQWSWEISSFVPAPNFNDGTIMGIKRASPRLRVAGPLTPTLRMSQSAEFHFDRIDVEDVPGDPNRNHLRVQGWDMLTQLDWDPEEDHHVRLTLLAFPQFDEFVGLDGLTPKEATTDFERDAEAIAVHHDWSIDERTSLELAGQFNRIGIQSNPQGLAPLEVIPEGTRGNFFHAEDRQTTHLQLQGTVTRRFEGDESSHLFQVGGEFHSLDLDGEFFNDTILIRGADDRLLRRIDFRGGEFLEKEKYEWAGFVQDRWFHGDDFWVDLGLRYSGDTVAEGTSLAPRVGVAWDPVGDGRTLLKAASGLLYRRVYIGEALWEQLPARVETITAADGTGRLQLLEPRLTGELERPWSVLGTLEASHRLSSSLLLRAKYARREGRDQIIVDRREPAGFATAPLNDPLSVLDDLPEAARGSLFLVNEGATTSWSLELTASYRLGAWAEIFASYVRSSAEGDLNDFSIIAGEIPDPVIRENRRGPLSIDVPNRFLAWGTVYLPWDLTLSPLVEWRSGFPYSLIAEDQTYAAEANTERFPSFFSADAQITKDVEIFGFRVEVGARFFNLTDHANPRQVIANVASDRLGEFRNGVARKVKAKFSLLF